MATDYTDGPISAPFASTGIRQFRGVVIGASGITLPTAGQPITGVLISSGTTGSTDATGKVGTIQIAGVAKMEAEASTAVKAGALVVASSVGHASTGTGSRIGRVVSGSSGAVNRIVSVHLQPLGSTAALT